MNNKTRLDASLESAINVIKNESAALARLEEVVRSQEFKNAVELCLDCKGAIYVIGMGKSGLVGQKIAATLTSTGTTAIYIHAGDALHGDLGAIRPEDIAILISKSGETRETLGIIPFLKNQGNAFIAITNEISSTLAKGADVILLMKVISEACPLNLAPMTSSTATMALGDALAGALIVAKDFKTEHFARLHPGGKLGWMLTAKVADMIDIDQNPVIDKKATLRHAVAQLVESRTGAVSVVDEAGILAGLITDGDLKRIIVSGDNGPFDQPVELSMTPDPMVIDLAATAAEAIEIMENRDTQISVLPVVDDEHRPVGMLRIHDIIKTHM